MRNIIRIGAGTDGRNRFVAIALGVALAAGTTITLQGADGASLAGHTFNVYQIGTYTDQILNGTQISSLGVRGTTASNAWAADAISIANAYDPSTADDIGKVYGYDDAGNIANIKMDSQTRQLRNISKALSQSTRKPAAIQGGANLTTTRSTLTINVPSEGLYYITDSAGNPIMIGTKSGNANIMKNDAKDPQWRTLGVAVVKAKSVRVDKKVQVQRNSTTVGKDGTTNDPVGVTVGDTVTNTVEVTVPNKQAASAVKFKLIDQPKGQTYVKGSLSVRLKNAPQMQMPVPSTDSRYSPSSGIPSRVNLHMRSPCPSIDPPIMPDARHIPSSCYFLSSVHESDTPSSPSGDDGPLPGCRPKMDSPSPNAPRDRSSPSNRSRSACSRSSRSQIS